MPDKSKFESVEPTRKRKNILSEIIGFLSENKKWWLLPIILMILLLGGIIILGGSAAAPFIYTLF